jgi:hypothetical protein
MNRPLLQMGLERQSPCLMNEPHHHSLVSMRSLSDHNRVDVEQSVWFDWRGRNGGGEGRGEIGEERMRRGRNECIGAVVGCFDKRREIGTLLSFNHVSIHRDFNCHVRSASDMKDEQYVIFHVGIGDRGGRGHTKQ